MKKILTALAVTTALASPAFADDGDMFGMGFSAFGEVGGFVDVTNIGQAIGDQTLVDSASVKFLEGGVYGSFDTEEGGEGGMFLNLYGATEGLALAHSEDSDGNGSAAGTSEMGYINIGGGMTGGLMIWSGESDD